MKIKKNIFIIIGSASANSANEKLVLYIKQLLNDSFNIIIYKNLKTLPHFDPEHSNENPPAEIIELRESIKNADGIIICTPEYIFSVPSGLKNILEWCVATTVFTDKPTGLITASASGQYGHEELKLIMKTLMARFTNATTLLIQGIKGKTDQHGHITDPKTREELHHFIHAFQKLIYE